MPCTHDRRTTVNVFDGTPLDRCDRCGLVFTGQYGRKLDHAALYRTYYNEMAGRFGFGIEHLIRAFRFFRAFKIFTIRPTAKTILDIGSGRGFMLYYLKRCYRYTRTAGTQISRNAYEFSRDKLGLEIYDKDLTEIPFEKKSFDIITMWHVLEHLPLPEKYLERIHELLRDDGRLVIEVPNYDSWSRRLSGKHWLGYDLEHHVCFFTPKSLTTLLAGHRFTVTKVHTFSMEYSTFLSAQSIASTLTGTDHLFFKEMQSPNGRRIPALHVLLIAILIPFCFLINILLFFFSRKGEVLFVMAEKEKTGGKSR